MKSATASLLATTVLFLCACQSSPQQATPKNSIVGTWRSLDGSYVVEFTPSGSCTARMRIQGRDVGGPCTYTVDADTITIQYPGPNSPNSVSWSYTLDGDNLTVSYGGNSVALQRAH